MKKIVLVLSIFLSLILSSLLVIGCQDEDFGYTKEEIFRGAYERNFVKAFGAIDPNETWDFSRYGCRHVGDGNTRAGETPYLVSDVLRDQLLRTKLSEGGDHKDPSMTFCFLSGNDNFTLTPIYRAGTATVWSFHLMVFTNDGDPKDITLWSNSMDNVLDIKTNNCNICGGSGYVGYNADAAYKGTEIACTKCIEGFVSNPTTDGDSPSKRCDICDTNGMIESSADCTGECQGSGKITCTNCQGVGYRMVSGNGGSKTYYTCRVCHVSKQETIIGSGKKNQLKKDSQFQAKLQEAIAQSTRSEDCPTCHGTGHQKAVCNRCGGDKNLYTCPICNGSSKVYACKANHDFSQWIPITGSNPTIRDTKTASAIQGYTKSTATLFEGQGILVNNIIPSGTLFYFYIETVDANGNTHITTSMDGGMREYANQNLGLPADVKIIGCEEGDDNDYNDVVFLLQGTPSVIHAQEDVEFSTTVSKRYMAEDFGSNADWDFNDIIVDVARTSKQRLAKKSGSETILIKTQVGQPSTNATIAYVCGTLSLQVKVGTTSFSKITDPTDQLKTIDELLKDTEPMEGDKKIGNSIGISQSVSGWDPDANNIFITVWKDWNNDGNADVNETNSGQKGVWTALFPEKGNVPYIIATDIKDEWASEGKNIGSEPQTSWFKSKYNGYYW